MRLSFIQKHPLSLGTIKQAQLAAIKHNREAIAQIRARAAENG